MGITNNRKDYAISRELGDENLQTLSFLGSAASIAAISEKVMADDNGISDSLTKFLSCFMGLATKGKLARAARITAWMSVDNNGNGMCSLAEVDGWIQKVLQAEFAENDEYLLIWKRFRPCYIRAFNDANDIAGEKGLKGSTTTTTDSYVTKTEFRLLCAYLCIYASMFEAFSMIDGKVPTGDDGDISDDDRRMSKDEFLAGWPKIQGKFGFAAIGALEAGDGKIFHTIDSDGKGMVLLKEWCEWLEKGEMEAGTDMGKALTAGDD